MKILVAVDGSIYTERMIGFLLADGWPGPRHSITVVHCAEQLLPRAAASFSAVTLPLYYASESERVLAPVRAEFGRHGIAATFVAEVGDAAQVVARMAADEGFELLVMGSHGRTALANVVLGSVVTKVIASCRTPVLVVR